MQDAQGNFYDCCLTLQPATVWYCFLTMCCSVESDYMCRWSHLTDCRLGGPQCFVMQDPMVTNQGYIFSKEAILDYFLTQKKLKKKELKEWEKAQQAVADMVRESSFFLLALSSTLSTVVAPQVLHLSSLCNIQACAGVPRGSDTGGCQGRAL